MDFESFLEGFDRVVLPQEVAIDMIFSGATDPPEIDSLLAVKYLPLNSFESIFDIEKPEGAIYHYGFIAWQSGNAPWHKSKHIAVVWYVSGAWAFLTTFTEKGELISNQLISYHGGSFNHTEFVESRLDYWLDEWSILSRYSICAKNHPCGVDYALHIVYQNGAIESKKW